MKNNNIIIKIIFSLVTVALVIFLLLPFYVIYRNKDDVITEIDKIQNHKVGIVFGASVRPDKTPSDMLRDRLDTAFELYESGKIRYILVSGDNNTKKYNEPSVMYQYLVDKGVPSEFVIKDFAGLRTYDTCIRANKLWKINKAVLITQEYHLYRALYTCEKLGIESIGMSATKHRYVIEDSYRVREYFAIINAIIDTYIIQPQYIGGRVEGDLSDN